MEKFFVSRLREGVKRERKMCEQNEELWQKMKKSNKTDKENFCTVKEAPEKLRNGSEYVSAELKSRWLNISPRKVRLRFSEIIGSNICN